MDTTTKPSAKYSKSKIDLKTSMNARKQEHVCQYCKKAFEKATTLATHMCVKKRRHMDADLVGSRLGLRAFQRFYEKTTGSRTTKTLDDFINSSYYIDFVKFGNHLVLLKPVYAEKYIDFVIMNGVKLKDWTKDYVYYTYIENLVKTEPAVSAVERTITEIVKWCEENKSPFSDFFTTISENEGSYLIKTGKISPWVLYLSSTAGNLLSRFSEDHSKMIGDIIEPGFWAKRFRKSEDDVEYIKSILQAAGI